MDPRKSKGKRTGNIQIMLRAGEETRWLPSYLIMEILSRLPLKTLLSCRCVCKTWLQIISDPFFVKLQSARSSTGILSCPLICDPVLRHLQFAHIAEEVVMINGGDGFYAEQVKFFQKSNLPISDFWLVNSCNGLVCLSGNENGKTLNPEFVYVCNPVLGEYLAIPVAMKHASERKFFCLGFNSRTNQYKILLTFNVRNYNSRAARAEAEIYTVGSGQWRSIGRTLCSTGSLDFDTSVNGCVHWLVRQNVMMDCDYISSFDFDSEQFRPITLPPHCHGKKDEFMKLGVLQSCLCLCFSTDCSSNQFDIWVMKEYGVKDSWTKEFVIENLENICFFYEPLIFLSKGKILMQECDGVVCYDTQRKRILNVRIEHGKFDNFVIAYNPCFVSLKDVAKEELVMFCR